jgi:arylsulfatase A-like enzyme
VIHQLDWCVGQVVATLERLGIREKTLVIFSSDNGPVLDDGYADGAVKDLNGHTPAGPLKGRKYSLYEAGTRVPFIASWPARIKPGTSDALICQIDLFHSLAALTGQKLGDESAPDSMNVLAALMGESKEGREHLIEQANGVALRKGKWKLIPNMNIAGVVNRRAANPGNARAAELYDLGEDLSETMNVARENPEQVKEMMELLGQLAGRQRTRE